MGDSPPEDDQVGSPAVPGPVASYTITPEDASDVISQPTRYLSTLDAVNEELWIIFTGIFESLEAELIFRKTSPENRNALRQTLRARGVDIRMAPRFPIWQGLTECYFADTAPVLELKDVAQQQSNAETSPTAENIQARGLKTSGNPDDGGDSDGSPSDDEHGTRSGGRGSRGRFPGRQQHRGGYRRNNEGDDFDDERVSSARKRMFMGFYHDANAKFGGMLHENFTTWSITLGMNVKAAAIMDEEVLDVLHVAFKGIALSFYQTDILTNLDGKAMEWALDESAHRFVDRTTTSRIYEMFFSAKFSTFRAEADVMELSELDALQRFVSKLQAWQMQLNRTYHTDMHLRDRIVQLFSAENDILLESFRDKPPETSNEAAQRISSRCSVIPGRINDKVIRREPSVLYVENVYRNK
jgi:hypothetical protein